MEVGGSVPSLLGVAAKKTRAQLEIESQQRMKARMKEAKTEAKKAAEGRKIAKAKQPRKDDVSQLVNDFSIVCLQRRGGLTVRSVTPRGGDGLSRNSGRGLSRVILGLPLMPPRIPDTSHDISDGFVENVLPPNV